AGMPPLGGTATLGPSDAMSVEPWNNSSGKSRRPAVRTGQLLKAVLVIELGAVTEKSSESTKLVPDFEIEIENAPKSGGRFATKSSATEALAPHPNAVASKRFLSVFT